MCRCRLLTTALFLGIAPTMSGAAPAASDAASNSSYLFEADGAWKGLNSTQGENPAGIDNGGFGFLPWDFEGGYHDAAWSPYGNLNHFVDAIDFPASSFNDLGTPAFGLTNGNQANYGYTSRATRVFVEPLSVGSSLSFRFDNPLLAPLHNNDSAGIILRLNSGGGPKLNSNPAVSERFGFFTTTGFHGGRWNTTDSLGVNDSGLDPLATSSGATFHFALESSDEYSFQIRSLDGSTILLTRTGTIGGAIDTLEILIFGNGSGNGATGAGGFATGERELFFDDLLVEQPTMPLLGDYNADGMVGAADYTTWRDHLGRTFSLAGENPTAATPSFVDQEDYGFWKANFGQNGGTDSAGTSSLRAAIPEPAGLALFLSATIVGAIIVRGRVCGLPPRGAVLESIVNSSACDMDRLTSDL